MTEEDRALVEGLRSEYSEVVLLYADEAADRIETLSAEVEREREHSERLHGQLQRMIDRYEAAEARNAKLVEANGILEDALQELGDDYPGSSCQEWCQQQVKAARVALEETKA